MSFMHSQCLDVLFFSLAALWWWFFRFWSTRAAILTSRWCLVNILMRGEGAETIVIWLRHLDLVMTKLQPASSAEIRIQDVADPNKPRVDKLATNLLIQGNKCPVVHHREEVNLQWQSGPCTLHFKNISYILLSSLSPKVQSNSYIMDPISANSKLRAPVMA